MKKKNEEKKQEPGAKNRENVMQYDTMLYALAGYLAQYASVLRHTAVKAAVPR